jgi:1,4-dihydroxy-2-naphthoate octaprenyltransferase
MLKEITNFLKENDKLLISTCSYSSPNLTKASYIAEGTELYIANVQDTSIVQQIEINPKVILTIETEEVSLTYHGYAEVVKDHPKRDRMIKTLSKKDKLSPRGIFPVQLMKIVPTEIEVPQWKFKHKFPENKPSILKETLRAFTSTLKIWIRAVRLPFVSVSVLAVLVGTAIAYFEGISIIPGNFLLAFFGIGLFHISADLFNDFFDHILGSDEINIQLTPFSGGSRFIQNKLFTPTRVLFGAIISLLACLAMGIYLNVVTQGNVIIYIGLAGAFMGIFYVGIPFKIVHYGLGELAIFLSFGPAIVFGSYYVQAERFSAVPIYASIIVGLFISLILFINQFPDYEADKDSGKKHWVVRLGRKRSTYLYIAFMVLNYALIILFIGLKVFPIISLVVLLTLPLPIKAIRTTLRHYDNYLAMIPAQAMTILTSIATSILLTLSFIFGKFMP